MARLSSLLPGPWDLRGLLSEKRVLFGIRMFCEVSTYTEIPASQLLLQLP